MPWRSMLKKKNGSVASNRLVPLATKLQRFGKVCSVNPFLVVHEGDSSMGVAFATANTLTVGLDIVEGKRRST